MSKRFSAQHVANGYAAMGDSLRRPRYAGVNSQMTVAESIARARRAAAMEAKRSAKKK